MAALQPIGKYWFKGVPLPAVNQAETTGEVRYWFAGLPLPVLTSYGAPPAPPAGSSALPTAMRLVLNTRPDERAAYLRRRFAPVYAVALVTDDGSISILW